MRVTEILVWLRDSTWTPELAELSQGKAEQGTTCVQEVTEVLWESQPCVTGWVGTVSVGSCGS